MRRLSVTPYLPAYLLTLNLDLFLASPPQLVSLDLYHVVQVGSLLSLTHGNLTLFYVHPPRLPTLKLSRLLPDRRYPCMICRSFKTLKSRISTASIPAGRCCLHRYTLPHHRGQGQHYHHHHHQSRIHPKTPFNSALYAPSFRVTKYRG
ncbi:hypothetical protein F4809DRAFT_300643 [Biscogniauxia mediterranea]|nr:hypothetical protein F4809DRAFT_300643 [Biscogniauxia mediterranea]